MEYLHDYAFLQFVPRERYAILTDARDQQHCRPLGEEVVNFSSLCFGALIQGDPAEGR
jgi:hypothetical protein